jgi:hypothetical protein
MLLQLLVLVHSQAGAYHFLAHPAQQEQRVALVQQVSKAFKDRQEAQEPLVFLEVKDQLAARVQQELREGKAPQEAQEPLVLALKVRLAQQVRLA